MEKTDRVIEKYVELVEKFDSNMSYGETVDGENIIIADWNDIPFGSYRLEQYCEKHDTELICGYQDEYIMCDHCYKYVYTTPGCYGDIPKYTQIECEILCGDCSKEFIHEIIEFHQNDPTLAIKPYLIEAVKEQGFVCLDDDESESCVRFENGFHQGQDDNPREIAAKMEKEGILDKYDYLFAITDAGQFDLAFTVMLREKMEDA